MVHYMLSSKEIIHICAHWLSIGKYASLPFKANNILCKLLIFGHQVQNF